jgi:hypothetical protein
MFSFKRFLILTIAVFIIVTTVSAQTRARTEMTPEEIFLQETIELLIINESARSQSREMKLIALDHIGDAIERGNRNDEIRQTLEFLAFEGRQSQTREAGRVVNNFPDVRRRAAVHLGTFRTVEATNTLLTILDVEDEPMVIQESIKSLGDIGINNNNETIRRVTEVVRRRHSTGILDNVTALATIDTFEKIAIRDGGRLSPDAIQLLIQISEGNYVSPVRERARMLINDLRGLSR